MRAPTFSSPRLRHLVFPAIVVTLLLVTTLFRLNGSSIGSYHEYFYGKDTKDSSLLLNKPQSIRSDEWLVTTQLTVAQSQNDFKQVNQYINGGRDVSLVTDVPYEDWSAVFKPQNLSFLFLPFEYAFAFKWWFLIAILLISIYYFFISFLPGRLLLASLAAIALSLNPFVFWWYQSITILPIAWGLIAITCIMYIIKHAAISANKDVRIFTLVSPKTLSVSGLLAYSMTAFLYVLYPPFQVPVLLTAVIFSIGYLLNHLFSLPKHKVMNFLKSATPLVIIPLIIASSFALLFLQSRPEAVEAISNTAYPGQRSVQSGGFDPGLDIAPYLEVMLQTESSLLIPQNRSAASSFLMQSFAFMLPLVFLGIWLYRKNKNIDWVIVAIVIVNIVFLAHFFLPWFSPVAKLLGLHMVPVGRLMIGVGFLGIISLAYLFRLSHQYHKSFSRRDWLIWGAILSATCLVYLVGGFSFILRYPGFISLSFLLFLWALTAISFSLMLTQKYKILGLVALIILGTGSVFRIHPLYIGMGPIYHSGLLEEVRATSRELGGGNWAVNQDILLENVPAMAGVSSVTGTLFYPNTDFWEEFAGQEAEHSYNRYAHVQLSPHEEKIKLVQDDLFTARLSCESLVHLNVKNIIGSTPLNLPCIKLVKEIPFSQKTIFIYRAQ